MPDIVKQEVSLAIIDTKLDNIMALLETEKDWRKQHEERIRNLEESTIRFQQILSTSTWVLGGISLLLSVVAGYIGVRF